MNNETVNQIEVHYNQFYLLSNKNNNAFIVNVEYELPSVNGWKRKW